MDKQALPKKAAPGRAPLNKAEGKLSRYMRLLVNKETIAYIIAGVLTTLVNFVSYEGLFRLGLTNLTANACAWVIAVTFAYFVNKKTVFLSKSANIKDEVAMVVKFFGARVFTLGVEQLGMYIFVDKLGFFRLLVKAGLAVVVTILNYLFSKLYIFGGKKTEMEKE